jgi:hypothetical protein
LLLLLLNNAVYERFRIKNNGCEAREGREVREVEGSA